MLTMMVCWSGAAARAGNITGTVHAEGKAGVDRTHLTAGTPVTNSSFVPKVDYASMRRDFVIYVDGPLSNAPAGGDQYAAKWRPSRFRKSARCSRRMYCR